jgi:hypothetical protein
MMPSLVLPIRVGGREESSGEMSGRPLFCGFGKTDEIRGTSSKFTKRRTQCHLAFGFSESL